MLDSRLRFVKYQTQPQARQSIHSAIGLFSVSSAFRALVSCLLQLAYRRVSFAVLANQFTSLDVAHPSVQRVIPSLDGLAVAFYCGCLNLFHFVSPCWLLCNDFSLHIQISQAILDTKITPELVTE